MKQEIDRDKIIDRNPLLEYVQALGWETRRDGRNYKTLCPFHNDQHPSLTLYPDNHYHCFVNGCEAHGTVIDLHMHLKGMSVHEAMCDLAGAPFTEGTQNPKKPVAESPKLHLVAIYDYEDQAGRVAYRVKRLEPKTFRQFRVLENGEEIPNMHDQELFPYHLPEIRVSVTEVWIVEGEKDADRLRGLDLVATCNSGGAGKWTKAHSFWLKDKDVIIVPDNDKAGLDHAREVLKLCGGVVRSARFAKLPENCKDVSEFCDACPTEPGALVSLLQLARKAPLIERAIDIGAYSIRELRDRYDAKLQEVGDVSLSPCNWVPGLMTRPLRAGDVLGIQAHTGNLKTAVALNLLACHPYLAAIYCQLELSGDEMLVRLSAIASEREAADVERIFNLGDDVNWQGKFEKVLVKSGRMSIGEIEEAVLRGETKLGEPVRVLVIDYVQLVTGKAKDRYERVSDACEAAKQLAIAQDLIVVLISQVARPEKYNKATGIQPVDLYEAKGSGSFENSCSLLLGMWKMPSEKMVVRVLKNSRGLPGNEVSLRIKGGSYVVEQDV